MHSPIVLFPAIVFSANGYWDSMYWTDDNWYTEPGNISGVIKLSIIGQDSYEIKNAKVELKDKHGSVRSGIVDPQGHFIFENLQPDSFRLIITSPDIGTITQEVSLSQGQDLQIKFPEISVFKRGDISGDGKIGLEEAINALRAVTHTVGE